jgi:hypothetical protein
VDRAGVRVAVRLPEPRARAAERPGLLPDDCGAAPPALPRARGAAQGRAAAPLLDGLPREGHHAREPNRGPAPVPRHLQARGQGGCRGAGAGGGSASPDGRHRGRAGAGELPGGSADERGRPCGSSGRSRSRCVFRGPPGSCRSAAAGTPAHAGRAAHRRAPPPPHHRLAPPPREARPGEGRALALAPGRLRGDHPRGRARPRHRTAPEAAGDRGEGAEAFVHVDVHVHERERDLAAPASRSGRTQPPRARRRLARSLGPRSGTLRLAARGRRVLRLHEAARARPHQGLGARCGNDGRGVPAALRLSPGRVGAAPLRERPHEPLHAPEGRDLLGAGRWLGGEGPCGRGGASAANGDGPPAQGPTTSPAPAPAASPPGTSPAPSGPGP